VDAGFNFIESKVSISLFFFPWVYIWQLKCMLNLSWFGFPRSMVMKGVVGYVQPCIGLEFC
jgi:hypothetical protein